MADEPLNEVNAEESPQDNAPAAENGAGGGDDWASALAGQEPAAATSPDASQPANFAELGDGETSQSGSQNLDFLLDIPLKVTVQMGEASMIINKMLQLTQGSVVELDKAAGEPVEIFVNDKLLGKGEVIVINDRFGVRITEIISPSDRIKNIG